MRSFFFGFVLVVTAALARSVTAAETTEPPRDAIVGQQVAELIQTGFVRGPTPLSQAQKVYESLRRDAENDARVDFAYGLVLWRNMKNKDAQAEFQAATKRAGTPYWPAWEALIWTHFVAREEDSGYARLLEFSKLINRTDSTDNGMRQDENHWIGRVMAAMEFTIDSIPRREIWLQTETKLMGLFDEDAIENYAGGKLEIQSRHAQLEDELRQVREKAKDREAAKLEKKRDQIEQTQEAIKEKREKLKKSAEEMKETFAEQTAAYEKQLNRLEKDYGYVERRSAMLLTTLISIEQEIALIQSQSNNRGANKQNMQTAIAQLQNQSYVYNADFQRNLAVGDQIFAKAQSLNSERAEFIAEYENATGERVKQNASMEKWKERAAKQAEALKKTSKDLKIPVPAAKIQAIKTFRTYIEFDPLLEKTKLLQSYGVAVVKP